MRRVSSVFIGPVAVTFLAATALCGPAFGQAGPPLVLDDSLFPEWNLQGSNTLYLEEYVVRGDHSQSPYPDEGFQPYNYTQFSFSRQLSPFEQIHGNAAGVLSHSPYRSTDNGFTFEQFSTVWEKGDTAVPFRAEVGDFFGFYSLRTLQRSLKGFQLDLQPPANGGGTRHSVQVMTGFSNPTYRSVEPDNDLYSGASWLLETRDFGNYTLNGVFNLRDQTADHPELQQTVVSLAGQKDVRMLGQNLSFEGEYALFNGDVDLGALSRLDRDDDGLLLLMEGRTLVAPLTYSFRYESYGADFQPNGGTVIPDQRLIDLRGGYRLESGMLINARLQKITDNLETGSALQTRVAGLTFSGPMLADYIPGSSLRLDATVQDVENSLMTTDIFSRSISADLAAPVYGAWVGNLGVRLQEAADHANSTSTLTREITIGGQRPIDVFGMTGSVSPGLLLRSNRGDRPTDDWGPSIALSLAGGAHAAGFNYWLLAQDPDPRAHVNTHNVNATYRYVRGAHEFGAEFATEHRDPEVARDTESYKFSVFWRVNFARPARPVAAAPALHETPSGGAPQDFRLVHIPPGLLVTDVAARLAGYGITGAVRRSGVMTYETRVLPSIDQRQRLAVVTERNSVARTALIVDLDDPTDAAGNSRLFERIREILIRRYGNPDSTFTIGQFSPSLVADVNRGAFIRTAEWTTGSGTMRLGIPRRGDRQVRIEIQLAPGFAPPRDTLWSIEQVR